MAVKGKVVDNDSGEPISQAVVCIIRDGEDKPTTIRNSSDEKGVKRQFVLTDADGVFDLKYFTKAKDRILIAFSGYQNELSEVKPYVNKKTPSEIRLSPSPETVSQEEEIPEKEIVLEDRRFIPVPSRDNTVVKVVIATVAIGAVIGLLVYLKSKK